MRRRYADHEQDELWNECYFRRDHQCGKQDDKENLLTGSAQAGKGISHQAAHHDLADHCKEHQYQAVEQELLEIQVGSKYPHEVFKVEFLGNEGEGEPGRCGIT